MQAVTRSASPCPELYRLKELTPEYDSELDTHESKANLPLREAVRHYRATAQKVSRLGFLPDILRHAIAGRPVPLRQGVPTLWRG